MPFDAVDLGVLAPVHREQTRLEGGDVVGLPEGDPTVARRVPPGLLGKLSPRSLRVALAILDETLDYRPGSEILAGEPGAARMGDEYLEMRGETVWEKTRGSHAPRHYAGRVTVPPVLASGDLAPARFDLELQLGHAEPLAVGVKRVTMGQLEHAASGFFEGPESFGAAVHGTRKSVKRVRALLRLVRGELPERVFRFENESLRDTGRILADIRAAQGVLDAATSLHDIYGDLLAAGTFGELLERLARRRDLAELNALEDPNLVGRVIRSLERAYQRFGSWPTDPDAREVYGVGIRDQYAAIRPGLGRTFAHGRRSMAAAYREVPGSDFHEWRKRVKDLRHQIEVLAPLWPEVLVGTAMTLDYLGDLLGEDNDLAELVDLVAERPDLCSDPRQRSLLRALAEQRRSELQQASEILGRRVFAEKPVNLTHRFGEYWESRQMAIRGSLDTLTIY